MHWLALQRQVRLAAIIQPEAACVQADSGLLRRVLVNMVANGLRFTPEGSCITLRAEPDAQRGVVLVVEDQGPGVPLDEQERIFQPFVQGKGEAQRGSGLGLAFCREVVLAHKGRIWVENQPAGGCHFSIWLPNAESSQQIEHGA
jgi:signal transduction histidine kinase